MIHKNRGNRRFVNKEKAKRKENIAINILGLKTKDFGGLHALSKGKVHQPYQEKTGGYLNRSNGPVDGTRPYRGGSIGRLAVTNKRYGKRNWKACDRRKTDSMLFQLSEYAF